MLLSILLYIFIILFIYVYIKYFFNNNIEKYNNNKKYTAIIIEPREHKALEFVLNNFVENLSNDWNFIIFHGSKNIDYILKMLNSSPLLKKNIYRIKLINLNVDNLTIKDYNKLLVSKNFYNEIPTEIFLIFQTDSIICSKNKDLINNFLKYDYSGAPWNNESVGNGGLSLRRKSKMIQIIDNCKYNNENEDVFFSESCSEIYRYKPTFDNAKEFSVEKVYNDNSFGIHKLWAHLSKNNIEKKNNFCDGLDELIKLNK